MTVTIKDHYNDIDDHINNNVAAYNHVCNQNDRHYDGRLDVEDMVERVYYAHDLLQTGDYALVDDVYHIGLADSLESRKYDTPPYLVALWSEGLLAIGVVNPYNGMLVTVYNQCYRLGGNNRDTNAPTYHALAMNAIAQVS